MFESKKNIYPVLTSVVHENEWGETVEEYAPNGTCNMFISLASQNLLQNADIRVTECSHIGLTHDELSVGDIIDDEYRVEFVNDKGRENIVFMKEIINESGR